MNKPLLTPFKRMFCWSLAVAIAGCGGSGGDADPNLATSAPTSTSLAQIIDAGGQVLPPPMVVATPVAVDKTAQKAQSRIGANVAAPGLYSRAREYVDLVRHAEGFGLVQGTWVTPESQGRGPLRVGADGWPQEDFSIFLMNKQEGITGNGGKYTIVFRGTATVNLIASPGALSAPRLDAETGMTVVDLVFPDGGDMIVLAFSNTNGGVKDLRVIRPGYDWKSPNLPVFTPEYLRHLEPFSTLRFMDWAASNILYETTWANRPTLANTRGGMTQPGGVPGYPWERVIELANAAKSDVWINIPAKADMAYVTELAKLLKRDLAPNLKIYVEYGNEFWNYNFPQYHWLTGPAVDAALAGGNTTLKRDGETSRGILGFRLYAETVVKVSDAFSAVFTKDQMISRVRPVLAWQAAGSYFYDIMLSHLKAIHPNRPVSEYLYAISGAPYFSLGEENQTKDNLTTQAVVAAMDHQITLAPNMNRYEHAAYLAKKNGIQWLAYEGGPDTFGAGSIAAKAAASRSLAMYSMCQRFLDDWSRAGGGLFMWYFAGAGNYDTQYGTWPIEERIDSATPSSKYQCMTWASVTAAPQAASRHPVATEFDAAETAGSFPVVGSDSYHSNRSWYATGQEQDYVVSTASTSRACYKLRMTSKFTEADAKFEVLVNGARAIAEASLSVAPTGSAINTVGEVCLDPGINVLSLRFKGGTWGILDKILISP